MNVKTRLLNILDNSRGAYVSGAALAVELSVSRNAVWKAAQSLREDGYIISAAMNKGYSLMSSSAALTVDGISAHLKAKDIFRIDVRKSVSSTNTLLRELAAGGAPEWYVVAAQEQTSGKGRMGRSFHSPAGHGAYFSLLLRPGLKSADAVLLTPAAAVAAALAIEEATGIRAGIKWVNDLVVDGKKVCGILTEATFDMESGYIESAVLGIGINVTRPQGGYPVEIAACAAPLLSASSDSEGVRCRLIAATLDYLRGFYLDLSARAFLSEYRARSVLLGRKINVMTSDGARPAKALEIDDDCRLVVRYENGETSALNSGEVSVMANEHLS